MGFRALRYVIGVAATTVIAGGATAPLGAYHFQAIPTYGVLANLIAVPITSFWVMPAGLLTLLAMPLGLDAWTVPLMAAGVEAVLATARWTAALPGASLSVGLLPASTLVLFTAGGIWLCLWRQRWRWLGLAPMALALALALLHRPPDLLVTPRLDMAAVRLEAGRVALLEWKRQALVRESWLRGLGAPDAPLKPKPGAEPIDGLACDAAGCVLRRDGVAVSLARGIRAAIEDCGRADLVIAGQTPRHCAAPTRLIGWRELAASQGLAVRIQGGRIEFETVAARRGAWPWAQ
jgi:competence protein ComEC